MVVSVAHNWDLLSRFNTGAFLGYFRYAGAVWHVDTGTTIFWNSRCAFATFASYDGLSLVGKTIKLDSDGDLVSTASLHVVVVTLCELKPFTHLAIIAHVMIVTPVCPPRS